MSWDILLHASDPVPPPVAEMPDDWSFLPLGPAGIVRRSISEAVPGVDWSDPTWGTFDGDGYSYEFNIGSEDPVPHAMVHVRGSGDAVSGLLNLAASAGWYLLDCSAGEWVHHMTEPAAGWTGFQAYRDQVVRRGTADGDTD